MTDRFRKLTRWLPVVLSMLGLLWGGCRSVEPVYQAVPASSDTREADPYSDTHVFRVGELVKFVQRGTNGLPMRCEERINEDGVLPLPGIGSVAAAGKTPRALQDELQNKYPRSFGSHPRFYFVGGEVRTPGAKAYLGKTTVSTAIQAAGDFTEFANRKKVSLTRPGQEPIKVNVFEALKDSKKDLPVFPGDRIDVPRKWWR